MKKCNSKDYFSFLFRSAFNFNISLKDFIDPLISKHSDAKNNFFS